MGIAYSLNHTLNKLRAYAYIAGTESEKCHARKLSWKVGRLKRKHHIVEQKHCDEYSDLKIPKGEQRWHKKC
jgi:hypothetical protein